MRGGERTAQQPERQGLATLKIQGRAGGGTGGRGKQRGVEEEELEKEEANCWPGDGRVDCVGSTMSKGVGRGAMLKEAKPRAAVGVVAFSSEAWQ